MMIYGNMVGKELTSLFQIIYSNVIGIQIVNLRMLFFSFLIVGLYNSSSMIIGVGNMIGI